MTAARHRPPLQAAVVGLLILAIASSLGGALTALVMIVLQGFVALFLHITLGIDAEYFESLPPLLRVAMPCLGALIIGLLFKRFSDADHRTGIAHLVVILKSQQGLLPLKNALVQLVGGTLGLISGLSGGRLGPEMHLAAASSYLPMLLLPAQHRYILILGAVATVFGATFSAPWAGVVFSFELMRQKPNAMSLLAVILATFIGTLAYNSMQGNTMLFDAPARPAITFVGLSLVALMGFIIGCTGSVFTLMTAGFAKISCRRLRWAQLGLAGLLTGVGAWVVPAIMGTGADTLQLLFSDTLVWQALLLLLLVKLFTSAACAGLGVPVGMFAPALLMGATCASLFSTFGELLVHSIVWHHQWYVVLGTWAMAAAIFRVPIAASLAVILTMADVSAMLPALITVLIATLTAQLLYHEPFYQQNYQEH